MKYGTTKFLPHHMNYIVMEAWDDFKVSSGKTIRENCSRTNIPPLSPSEFTTNNQACVASSQVSSRSKAEQIKGIAVRNVAPIGVEEIRTDNSIVILQAKWII